MFFLFVVYNFTVRQAKHSQHEIRAIEFLTDNDKFCDIMQVY